MLRPQDSSTCERKSLNGLWDFRLDSESEGRAARWFSRPLPDSRQMAVPASFNDIAAEAEVRDYFGDVWYQRSVWVPPGWQGRRIVLHFESATHRATVWVDDVEVMSHEGGTPPSKRVDTDSAGDLGIKVILRDAEGAEVTTDTGPSGTLNVPTVHKGHRETVTSTTWRFRWYAGTLSWTATTKASGYAPFRWTAFGS